jgi:chromosome segregation ATPase
MASASPTSAAKGRRSSYGRCWQPGSDTISRIRSYFARLGTSLIDRFALRQAEGIAGRVRTSEAELDAARAEIRRLVETADAYRIEAARQAEAAARLQQELFSASRAEASRQAEAVAGLQQELSVARAEAARQTEAAGALQQQCAEARSELARLADATSHSQMDVQKATERIALLKDELEAARAEIARQDAADASRAALERRRLRSWRLGTAPRARNQTSEAIAQRGGQPNCFGNRSRRPQRVNASYALGRIRR